MNKINLTGLKKCDQLWDEMMPNECGRLCQKCNKTIIDFRKLSDEEMTKIHLFKTEPICGIYRPDQLEFPSSNSRKLAFQFWKSLSFSLLTFLFSRNLEAQNIDTIRVEQIETNDINSIERRIKNELESQSVEEKIFLRGRLLDETKRPLVGASIFIKGSQIGMVTDRSGLYGLDLTTFFEDKKTITIICNYTGYGIIEKVISLEDTKQNLDIILKENLELTEFTVSPSPWHKRLWRKLIRLFKKN